MKKLMKIDLRDEALSKYDGYLKDKLSEQCRDQSNPSFGQYNLLAHLSTYFDNDIVVDIGTGATAASARALSYNETNTVYSYDTEFSEIAKGHIDRLDNVIYEVFNPLKSSKEGDIILFLYSFIEKKIGKSSFKVPRISNFDNHKCIVIFLCHLPN